MSPIVYLNVGGCFFVTRRDTLRHGFFLGIVESITQDGSEVFIDRDPTHFRYVLNWMRGVRTLPEDEQTLTELMWEADFYALDDMVAAIADTRRRFSMLKTLDVIASSIGHS